jgi:hypothetical protein
MFRSLLAAAEAKWTAAGQWNQTERAGANENPETNAVFALYSVLSVLSKARQDPVNRQRPIPRAFAQNAARVDRSERATRKRSERGMEGEVFALGGYQFDV